MKITWIFVLLFCFSTVANSADFPEVQLPSKLSASNILVLYNEFDSLSKQIAEYYAQQRHIPSTQIVSVAILNSPEHINEQKFESIYAELAPHLTENIKVIVLTWHAPYRVDCMSITSAFALGFDKKYCSHPTRKVSGCHKTANSSFYNASSSVLWQHEPPLRLSMMLSGETLTQAKVLIDRGVLADNSHPKGDAYLVRTHDHARSSRSIIFEQFADIWGDRKGVNVLYIDNSQGGKKTGQIQNKNDILFYHTGLKHVPSIKSNQYLPGAIADHLTSGAGIGIEHSGQMKAFRWLEAGLTGSYGAVIEPCNYIEKFPNPQILIPAYRWGDSLIEAYWKSVQQPGEGLFIGEPLARPWDKTQLSFEEKTLIITSQELDPEKKYVIEAQQNELAIWEKVNAVFSWKKQSVKIHISDATAMRYRISEEREK